VSSRWKLKSKGKTIFFELIFPLKRHISATYALRGSKPQSASTNRQFTVTYFSDYFSHPKGFVFKTLNSNESEPNFPSPLTPTIIPTKTV
jgi:hypothetical protein